MKKILLLSIISVIFANSDKARITVYKDGTALIKQPVFWPALQRGLTSVTFDKLPSGLNKETPFIILDGAKVISQRFNDKTFSSNQFFKDKRGDLVTIKSLSGKSILGRLIEYSEDRVTLETKQGIRAFTNKNIEFIESKDLSDSPIIRPFLSWDIKTTKQGIVKGDLTYKSSNFDWSTVYRLILNGQEKGELVAEAVIKNNSDLNFNNVEIKLVEGNLHQSNYKKRMTRSDKMMSAKNSLEKSSTSRGSLGDYHIYSLNEKHNLRSRESISVRMYGPLEIGYEKTYVFENSERGQKEEPLQVQLEIENNSSNGLGIPLPGGKVEMYTYSSTGDLEFIGSDNMGQVPKNQSCTLISGYAFDVIGKRTIINFNRQRKSEEAVIEIQVKNNRNDPVSLKLVEHINGDWIVKDQSHDYKKIDSSTIQFFLSVEAGKSEYVTYTYRKEWK
tara:strand:- start:879 stop:2216 length:1338 start_codon:yes stop_codon:yes gene_type:complete